ncbi:MAG: phosphoenolpyruvate--protein phosphotransferase [Lachnospiraceae bacterium]|nr:phosphoenolpyruvate--protein phosphotransferase [Lachnospiraceae bacterium]
MKVYSGKSVFGGVAIGKICVYKKTEQLVRREKITDVEAELARFEEARERAIEQLKGLYEKALKEVGEVNAAIFDVHQMMLEDEDYNESIRNIVGNQKVNVEYAVAQTSDNFAQMFASMDDDYMRERAADVKDISERLLTVLGENDFEKGMSDGVKGEGREAKEPVIIVADDLAPSETVQLDKDMVLSFVTVHGSLNSHTAILARTMAIPALIGTPLPLDETVDGKLGIVDGVDGTIYVEPDEETLAKMKEKQRGELEKKEMLQTLKGRETVTVDGQKLMLYANIGNIKDLATVMQNDAGGIGLFRSEFIYLESEHYPTEEEQFQIYKQVAETMAGKRVIIRTLDIGADKQCDYFEMEHEENPALGYRAIRICLTRPEVFKTQLRALLRASIYGKIAIMYPMITSMEEIKRIKEIVREVRKELDTEGLRYGEPEQGIMIETPAAALISDELATEVDFFSIGTNDLTQYTLAIDRQNTKLDEFYDAHHPAILKMIRMVVENAHGAGIWAGICGELGADESLTREFLAMGVDELSVSPGSVLPIRKIVLETNVQEYQARLR